jgi:hypothetical protein
MGWYGAANNYRISRKHSFNSGTGLGLHRSSQIPSAAPQDGKAYGAQGSDSRMPARKAMVFSPLRLGRFAANRCKLLVEGQ